MTNKKINSEGESQPEGVLDLVQIPRAEWESLKADIEKIKTGRQFQKPKKVTEHFANIRFHDGKPVVWYGNVHEVKDKLTGKLVAYMDIKLDGEEGTERVEYLAFLNTPNSVKVEIKKQEAQQIVTSLGVRRAVNLDEAKISGQKFAAREYEDEVVSYEYTATIEVIDGEHKGETYIVPSNCLNQ